MAYWNRVPGQGHDGDAAAGENNRRRGTTKRKAAGSLAPNRTGTDQRRSGCDMRRAQGMEKRTT